jgi:hypothetical protein
MISGLSGTFNWQTVGAQSPGQFEMTPPSRSVTDHSRTVSGTASWVVEGSSPSHRIRGDNIVPSDTEDQSSYRSELSGLYGITASIHALCEFYKIDHLLMWHLLLLLLVESYFKGFSTRRRRMERSPFKGFPTRRRRNKEQSLRNRSYSMRLPIMDAAGTLPPPDDANPAVIEAGFRIFGSCS